MHVDGPFGEIYRASMSKDKYARLLRAGAFASGPVEREAQKSATAVAAMSRAGCKKLLQRGVRKVNETRRALCVVTPGQVVRAFSR